MWGKGDLRGSKFTPTTFVSLLHEALTFLSGTSLSRIMWGENYFLGEEGA